MGVIVVMVLVVAMVMGVVETVMVWKPPDASRSRCLLGSILLQELRTVDIRECNRINFHRMSLGGIAGVISINTEWAVAP